MSDARYIMMVAGNAKAGMEKYVKRFLTDLMHQSRQDEGCLLYNVHQSSEDASQFMLYSVWKNKASFDKHDQTAHMQEFINTLVKDMFDLQSQKTTWHLIDEA